MKRYIPLMLSLLLIPACSSAAEAGRPAAFAGTYAVQTGAGGECQATVIGTNTLLTAAHCFRGGMSAVIPMSTTYKVNFADYIPMLADKTPKDTGIMIALDQSSISVPSDYDRDSVSGAKNDLAVIRVNPVSVKIFLTDTASGAVVPDEIAKAVLSKDHRFKTAVATAFTSAATLVKKDNADSVVTGPVTVKIMEGPNGRSFTYTGKIEYSKNTGYFYTETTDFVRGMSGAGVFAEDGKMLGVVSKSTGIGDKTFALFTPFTEGNISFIRPVSSTAGSKAYFTAAKLSDSLIQEIDKTAVRK
ncbi:V8-like Glu-specific endopeptidase [Parelusimicrobium proximum]|uniref:trypsin-like serine protease n=1 Tax=Parelusimicrobium proximum TaxID=3228953 RepID=UPI003D16529E